MTLEGRNETANQHTHVIQSTVDKIKTVDKIVGSTAHTLVYCLYYTKYETERESLCEFMGELLKGDQLFGRRCGFQFQI